MIFSHEFMRNAFIAGGGVGIATGLVGYFLVLREEVFAADALSHVAFTGSLAALAYGVNQHLGLFGATIVVAIGLALLSARRFANDVAVGTTFSWLLGLGALFLYVFTTNHSTSNSDAGPNVLFGSIFGISRTNAWTAAALGVAVTAAVAVMARPLLFASVDNAIARLRGIRTTTVGIVFMVLVALQVSEAVQVVGALLLLGLLTSPAATAIKLARNPYSGMALSSALCVACIWAGLAISYAFPQLPPSFVIITLGFVCQTSATVLTSTE